MSNNFFYITVFFVFATTFLLSLSFFTVDSIEPLEAKKQEIKQINTVKLTPNKDEYIKNIIVLEKPVSVISTQKQYDQFKARENAFNNKDVSKISEQQVCMAAFIKMFAWSEHPTGGESPIGKFAYYVSRKHRIFAYKTSTKDVVCQVVNNRVFWKNIDGRWRTHPLDTKISFEILNDKVAIILDEGNGYKNIEYYDYKYLKKYAP